MLVTHRDGAGQWPNTMDIDEMYASAVFTLNLAVKHLWMVSHSKLLFAYFVVQRFTDYKI